MKKGCEALLEKYRLQGGCWATSGISTKPIRIHYDNDSLTEIVRKEVPESMAFTDDVVLCGRRYQIQWCLQMMWSCVELMKLIYHSEKCWKKGNESQ